MCLLAHWGWLNLVMCSHVLKVLLCWPNTAIHSHVLIGLHWLNTVMCFHMLRLIAYWLNILMCSCTGSIWQWVLICSLAHCSLAQYGNALVHIHLRLYDGSFWCIVIIYWWWFLHEMVAQNLTPTVTHIRPLVLTGSVRLPAYKLHLVSFWNNNT